MYNNQYNNTFKPKKFTHLWNNINNPKQTKIPTTLKINQLKRIHLQKIFKKQHRNKVCHNHKGIPKQISIKISTTIKATLNKTMTKKDRFHKKIQRIP